MAASNDRCGMRLQGAYDEDDTAALRTAFEKGLTLIGQTVHVDAPVRRKLACAVLHTFTSRLFNNADELVALSVTRVLRTARPADATV